MKKQSIIICNICCFIQLSCFILTDNNFLKIWCAAWFGWGIAHLVNKILEIEEN